MTSLTSSESVTLTGYGTLLSRKGVYWRVVGLATGVSRETVT
jgi:hypothetical protein